MGSSTKKNFGQSENLVTLTTDALKDRLNRLYESLRSQSTDPTLDPARRLVQEGVFDYLWDFKERALLAGQTSVDLPKRWLDDLEQSLPRNACFAVSPCSNPSSPAGH